MDALEFIAKYLHKHKLVRHSTLLTYLSSKRIKLAVVKIARMHLYEMGKIEFYWGKEGEELEEIPPGRVDSIKRGLWYRWKHGEKALER